ncbi:hypothetical protein [Candidatus Methylomirabilis sp.]|uniref:hypothetical protein n=1 Tax=Candidatus Methylomirabilis sp. TaxID=2032687 RepID=UPI0030765FE7
MILIDTFLFSEPSEKEVLLTKLNLGSDLVSEWVLVENAYTFRGEYKGLFAEHLIASPEFDPFRSRISVISLEIAFPKVRPDDSDGDDLTFPSQYAQRDSAMGHLLRRWSGQPDAWVLISDTDECLDVSTPLKRHRLLRATRLGSDLLTLDRRRFWFDFDNRWFAKRSTPLVRMSALAEWVRAGESLGELRGRGILGNSAGGLNHLLYEYSTCFDISGVYRKYDTVAHVGMLREDIDRALSCNHRPQFRIKGQQLGLTRDDWLERVKLTERNSPTYVRENFERLRTGNIPDNYVENRRRLYPEFFSPLASFKRRSNTLYEDLRDAYRTARNRLNGRRFPSLVQ